jgi:hypothetical protein
MPKLPTIGLAGSAAIVCVIAFLSFDSVKTNSKSKTIKTPGNFKTSWTGARSDALQQLDSLNGSSRNY